MCAHQQGSIQDNWGTAVCVSAVSGQCVTELELGGCECGSWCQYPTPTIPQLHPEWKQPLRAVREISPPECGSQSPKPAFVHHSNCCSLWPAEGPESSDSGVERPRGWDSLCIYYTVLVRSALTVCAPPPSACVAVCVCLSGQGCRGGLCVCSCSKDL